MDERNIQTAEEEQTVMNGGQDVRQDRRKGETMRDGEHKRGGERGDDMKRKEQREGEKKWGRKGGEYRKQDRRREVKKR